MLCSVFIENIALIKKLSLELSGGFCAFTGETGAGKSMVIDSLSLLCGARSDRELIRSGETEAIVEGTFSSCEKEAAAILAELDIAPEEDGSLTVSRKIMSDGRTQARINGRAVPLSKLKALMQQLISIHGQQDTYAFSDAGRQLEMLDSFANDSPLLEKYAALFSKSRNLQARIDTLSESGRDREQRLDMLRYRISELKSAAVSANEKTELESEKTRLVNNEKIVSNAGTAYDALYAADGSALENIRASYNAVNALSGIIPDADALSERLDAARCELADIAEALREYTDSDDGNTFARLDEVETRLEYISRLERKYKVDSTDFPALLESWESEMNTFENSDAELVKLRSELDSLMKELQSAAGRLTDTRKQAAQTLALRVTSELAEVDMPAVCFTVRFNEKKYSETGADDIEFLISANKGEAPKPISKIASGGELSRIMLCLKCVFANTESIGTLIFDEIDSGISGRTSEKIGVKLKKAADGGRTQVICVTHSAILASVADTHYKISKTVSGNRTETGVEKLCGDSRRDEIARILGGMNVTDTVLAAASEMLSRRNG